MGVKLAAMGAMFGAVLVAYGCTFGLDSTSEGVGSTEEAVNNGLSTFDAGSNPVAAQFPLSTVLLTTPAPDAGWVNPCSAGGRSWGSAVCTGVIVSRTQVLTAAHCRPNPTTTVSLYGNSSDVPTGTTFHVSATTPVAYPPGVVCDPDADGGVGNTCNSDAGVFADLAVATIDGFILSPNKPVTLPQPGGFRSIVSSPQASWLVGTGMLGDGGTVVWNTTSAMRWAPVILTNANDAGDDNGAMLSRFLNAAPGDSGGPLYRLLGAVDAGADAGLFPLTPIGILSQGNNAWIDQCKRILSPAGFNTYTSLLEATNNAWAWAQLDPLRGPELRQEVLPGLAQEIDPSVHEGPPSAEPLEGTPGVTAAGAP